MFIIGPHRRHRIEPTQWHAATGTAQTAIRRRKG
jgi:hypothetical protein